MSTSTTAVQLVLRGWWQVNLPVTAIILAVWTALSWIGLPHVAAVLVGVAVGWWYWSVSIKRWIQWAHGRGVPRDRILRIGRWSLLLFQEVTVAEALRPTAADEQRSSEP